MVYVIFHCVPLATVLAWNFFNAKFKSILTTAAATEFCI